MSFISLFDTYFWLVAVSGGWSTWSNWTECSQTCDNSTQSRERICNTPSSNHLSNGCHGNHTQVEQCYGPPCPSEFIKLILISVYKIDIDIEYWIGASKLTYTS